MMNATKFLACLAAFSLGFSPSFAATKTGYDFDKAPKLTGPGKAANDGAVASTGMTTGFIVTTLVVVVAGVITLVSISNSNSESPHSHPHAS